MNRSETARVQEYLQRTFNNTSIAVKPPKKAGQPVEVYCGDEFIGVLHRDEEEGEVSYDLHMTILDLDLPPDPSDMRGI